MIEQKQKAKQVQDKNQTALKCNLSFPGYHHPSSLSPQAHLFLSQTLLLHLLALCPTQHTSNSNTPRPGQAQPHQCTHIRLPCNTSRKTRKLLNSARHTPYQTLSTQLPYASKPHCLSSEQDHNLVQFLAGRGFDGGGALLCGEGFGGEGLADTVGVAAEGVGKGGVDGVGSGCSGGGASGGGGGSTAF